LVPARQGLSFFQRSDDNPAWFVNADPDKPVSPLDGKRAPASFWNHRIESEIINSGKTGKAENSLLRSFGCRMEECFVDATFVMAKGGGTEIGATKRGKA
jgi:hypothetical protein